MTRLLVSVVLLAFYCVTSREVHTHVHHHLKTGGTSSGVHVAGGYPVVHHPQTYGASHATHVPQRLIHVVKIKKADGTYETKIFTGADAALPAEALVPKGRVTSRSLQRTIVPATTPLGASAGLQNVLAQTPIQKSYVPGGVTVAGGIPVTGVPVQPYVPMQPIDLNAEAAPPVVVPSSRGAPPPQVEPEKENAKDVEEVEEEDEVEEGTKEPEANEPQQSEQPPEVEVPVESSKVSEPKEPNYLLNQLKRERAAIRSAAPLAPHAPLYQPDRLTENGSIGIYRISLLLTSALFGITIFSFI